MTHYRGPIRDNSNESKIGKSLHLHIACLPHALFTVYGAEGSVICFAVTPNVPDNAYIKCCWFYVVGGVLHAFCNHAYCAVVHSDSLLVRLELSGVTFAVEVDTIS